MRAILTAIFVATLVTSPSAGQEKPAFRVLPEDFNADKKAQMMRSYLRGKVHAALDRRLETLDALDTPEQITAYQDRLRDFFAKTVDLDSFQPGTPLNARTTGVLERDGYRVEKVIFESQPGFFVTGNLYLPAGASAEKRVPGILHPCGHTENGKAAGIYQKVNILLAKNGLAVFCYDPIGQGERKQLLNEKGAGLLRGSSEHQALGVAPIPLGRGLASYMIWDGIRGLDYLASRPEIDPDQLGCTGNSGGGNMTSFLMALDPRIRAAAPGCFVTTTRQKNESPGPGDAEQNHFAQIREGLDHPDYAILRAPKPTMILSATYDFVPIDGTWLAFRQGKQIYTKLGASERIGLVEVPEKHGYSKGLREGSARFFSRWLLEKDIVITEPDEIAVEKDVDLLCTPEGQVVKLEGAKTMFDLNAARAEQLATARADAWAALAPAGKRAAVREILGLEKIAVASQTPVDKDQLDPGIGAKLILETSDGLKIPMAMYFQNLEDSLQLDPKSAEIVLFLHDEGIGKTHPAVGTKILTAPDRQWLYAADLCDIGETKTRNWRFYGADAAIAYMLGESFLKYRTEQILMLAESIASNAETKPPLHLHAYGEIVPAALHAAALEPDLFESVTLHGGLKSWGSLMRESNRPTRHIHNVAHGALRVYDLPDLVELIPDGKLTWLDAENE
ncbi:MAG: hypothetical protein HKN23_11415 [Verrucomicrobiales bacterium]|nr:hypothetical protein [Verrucomicrobiales bacterium]